MVLVVSMTYSLALSTPVSASVSKQKNSCLEEGEKLWKALRLALPSVIKVSTALWNMLDKIKNSRRNYSFSQLIVFLATKGIFSLALTGPA